MPFDQNQLPTWNKEGVEPPQSLKDEGWQPSQKPPSDYFNWFFNKTFKALQSLFSSAQHKEEKGQPNGYAALNADGKVVNADGSLPGGVTSVNNKTGAVTLSAADVGAVSTETFATHTADSTTGAHKAKNIAVEDANNHFTGTDVESVLNELFTFANDGKTAVANAITAKGVSADPTETFASLATKIGQISIGKKVAVVNDNFGLQSNNGAIVTGTRTITGLSFTPTQVLLIGSYTARQYTGSNYGGTNNGIVAWGDLINIPYNTGNSASSDYTWVKLTITGVTFRAGGADIMYKIESGSSTDSGNYYNSKIIFIG